MRNPEITRFLRKIQGVERTRARVEKLCVRQQLTIRDVESLYEGLFLRSVTAFEGLIECVFFQALRGQIRTSTVGGKITATSNAVLRDVLLDGKDYLEWLPYNRTLDRARRYLRGGRPFTHIENDDLGKLTQITRIRNAVAHSSKHAKEVFRKKVIVNVALLPREQTPAGFLRSLFRSAPAMTRFEMFLAELGRMASTLDV
jgi:hypothetical protein